MSLNPELPSGLPVPNPESAGGPAAQPSPPDQKSPRAHVGWQRRLLRISLALFIFEVGAFLVIFPWTEYWNLNYFQSVAPALQNLWYQPSFRGAITGLGFVNVYIACLQLIYSFRRS
jgi:hypothetical protein